MNGFRQTIEETGVPDAFEVVMRARHEALLQKFDHATAGAMMVAFGSALNPADKSTIARIVLTAE